MAREDEVLNRLAKRLGYHVTSSARAVVDALGALSAKRIALVSPYPDSLTQHSMAYWQARGLVIDAVQKVTSDEAVTGHPIYGLGSDAAIQALTKLRAKARFDFTKDYFGRRTRTSRHSRRTRRRTLERTRVAGGR